MLRIFCFIVCFSELASARTYQYPGGFQSYFWQQAQFQHLQTQQQLQAQDQYRRNLLIQDQQRQIQQLMDQQSQIESMQRNAIMHQYADRLRMFSYPIKRNTAGNRNKNSK